MFKCTLCEDKGYVLHKLGPDDTRSTKVDCPRCRAGKRMLKADTPQSVDMQTAAKLLAGEVGE